MFVGRHVRQLDEKGRLAIPAEHLELLLGADREEMYVTPGKQGCIWLVPKSYYLGDFTKVVDSFDGPGGLPDQFFHVCQRRGVDKAGRILIDPDARELAAIPAPDAGEKVSVVICGSGRYLQVWNKADYDARFISARQQFQNLPGGGNAFGGGTGSGGRA